MFRFFISALMLLLGTAAWAAPAPQPLLPPAFAGWRQVSSAPAAPAGENAAAFNEYGLRQGILADYGARGRRLAVHAWRFRDATGAYGAFTLLRQPQMHDEAIGSGGAAEGSHYLLWRGATVVDAVFSQPGPRDHAALNALAAKLPKVEGASSVPPSLPKYLPAAGLDAASVRYSIGPVAYQQTGGVLAPQQIGFGMDAEAVTAQYGRPGAQGTLTLILYPTPQIAAEHLKAIRGTTRLPGMMTKRSGPLVAVVSGAYPQAKELLDRVRFRAVVTMDRTQSGPSEVAKLAQLLLSIAVLTGVLVVGSVVVAFFLGGGRALVRRMRGKPASSVDDEEIITLNLDR